jgi:hypothetical protein
MRASRACCRPRSDLELSAGGSAVSTRQARRFQLGYEIFTQRSPASHPAVLALRGWCRLWMKEPSASSNTERPDHAPMTNSVGGRRPLSHRMVRRVVAGLGASVVVGLVLSLTAPSPARAASRRVLTVGPGEVSAAAKAAPTPAPAPGVMAPARVSSGTRRSGNLSFAGPPLPVLAALGALALFLGRAMRAAIRPNGGRR